MKKYISLSIATLLFMMSFITHPVTHAQNKGSYKTKDEVVYGKLSSNGSVQNMYVVNSFAIEKHGTLIDYGNYEDLRNLTNLEPIEKSGERITVTAEEDDFYYQGNLQTKDLPWNINITYYLDGEEIPARDLAGQSGKLEIHIQTEENEVIDDVFYEHYLLQIMASFDPLHFENIQAPKGTEANEGKNKLITFSVMPGQDEILIATAEARNIELEPIEITAIPANIALDDVETDDVGDELEKLTDAITQIHDGVTELEEGTKELKEGSNELKDGSSQYAEGMYEINNSSSQLVSGSEQILHVLNVIDVSLKDMPEMPDIDVEELQEVPSLLQGAAESLREFANSLDGLIEMIDGIEQIEIPDDTLEQITSALKEAGIDEETIKDIERIYEFAEGIAGSIGEDPEIIQEALFAMANRLEDGAKEMRENLELLEELESFGDLESGLGELAREYRTFHQGLQSYTGGVDTLAREYDELNEGIGELADGTTDLHDGVSELEEGTGELHEQTKDLPDELKSELEKMLDEFDFSDFEPTSFVSDKNENIGVVQFVLRTEKIELDDDDDKIEDEEEEKSLWQRFLDLFRW